MKRRILVSAVLLLAPIGLSACSADAKPAKSDAVAAFKSIIAEQMPESVKGTAGVDQAVDKIANCVLDKSYDGLSVDSLKKLAGGDAESSLSKEDNEMVNGAVETCQTELLDELTALLKG